MKVIFIHGPAASGKFTIGKALAEATGIPLFHNHLTVDLALSLFAFGSKPFCELRETIWLTTFRLAAEVHQSLIFTFHPEATVSAEFIDKMCQTITGAGGQVDFVELQCPEEALLQRIGNRDRAEFGKLTDPHLYRDIQKQGGFEFPPLPASSVRIDTASTDAKMAAQQIQAALGL